MDRVKEKELIKKLCKINYETSTNLINNNALSMKEYKEMLFTIILGLNGIRK